MVEDLGVPKAHLKKFHLHKKFLKKEVKKELEVSLPISILNRGMINPVYEGPEIEILFEDQDFLAINKPPRIHSFPLIYGESDNCLSFLRSKGKFKECLEINLKSMDRGLLFRLDYETSGVLVFAKKEEVYNEVRPNFNSLMKEKFYLALVKGELKERGIHRSILRPSGKKGHKMVCEDYHDNSLGENEHVGVLEVLEAEYDPSCDLTLVKIKLETGLRHQIRVMLSKLGHPIIGDSLYGDIQKNESRLYLHAYQYSLTVFNKEWVFKAEDVLLFSSRFPGFFDFDCSL